MKIGLPCLVGNGVKVAVVALSVAEWYMNVYSRHYFCFSVSVGNGNEKFSLLALLVCLKVLIKSVLQFYHVVNSFLFSVFVNFAKLAIPLDGIVLH